MVKNVQTTVNENVKFYWKTKNNIIYFKFLEEFSKIKDQCEIT